MRTFLLVGVVILMLATPAASAQTRPELLRGLDQTGLSQLLQAAGFTASREHDGGFIVTRASGGPEISVRLLHCEGQESCSHLRIRGVWLIGDRQAARAAAQNYDRTVPIAFVAIVGDADSTTVYAGRDVWMTPGHTMANLVAELEFSFNMAIAMTQALEAADPGIRAFWKSHDAR
ncbi:MAG: hypothetical protein ACT4OF_02160 [Caulobacteraceae bacterium]